MRLALTLSLLAVPAVTAAQARQDSALTRALSTIPDGAPIRVALLRSRWTGAFMGARGDSVFLGVANQPPMVVLFNAVDTLWRSESAGRVLARRGALWTGIAGGLAMAIVGANAGGGEDAVPFGLAGVAGGAAAGALAGALIGSRLRHWRRIFAVPAVSPF